ncbi:chitooligosaccharidolytic beta-N-acetylglucosaminidase isoform X1 [Folsomia candida]|uniref:chitooligosaccharidolytic beta-N-acetylglucosaminidase isoform X1 n=1 Tax=Folsomia candida TaxID=158441 RepID=UPI000B8F9D01|nr:chitooligosaccharidolytic beta-N-acetylglucosaminidase isoform X1 [Folsomia candida]
MYYSQFLVALLLLVVGGSQAQSVWTYTCRNEKFCQRVAVADLPGGGGVPLDVCKLNCDKAHGSLFPLPTGQVTLGPNTTPFYPGYVTPSGYDAYPIPVRDLFRAAAGIFIDYLNKMRPSGPDDPIYRNAVNVRLTASDTSTAMFTLGTDESYTLTVSVSADGKTVTADISAVTFFGARHGLETLSQLIAYDEDLDVLQIVNTASIVDKPVYLYRGLALDTARNFISLDGIKKVIDGLSYNKMNMFHWHISDTNSFAMEVEGWPQFTTHGAYSSEKIYSLADMRDLVAYARARGVKIVPEFDEPAHVGFGWEWGPSAGLGNLVVCLNEDPWYDLCLQPPCGQLNIVNDNVYVMLGHIFTSMLKIFDNDLFHMGGDEVHFGCYNSSEEIKAWMAANGTSTDVAGFVSLWGSFQHQAHDKLVAASSNKDITGILWTSELTHREYISEYLDPAKYVIQIWTETLNADTPAMITDGYRVIFSNYDALYLDCGFNAWLGSGHNWCSPYKGWQSIYDHSPHGIYANATNSTMADAALADGRLLGAEAPLWVEQADEKAYESRLWPRGAALGERLWTNPTTNWADAEHRMVTNRNRMVARGINADAMQPEYCSMYQNKCYGPGAWDGEVTSPPTSPQTPAPSPATSPQTPAPSPPTSTPPSSTTQGGTGAASSTVGGIFLVITSLLWSLSTA